MYLFDHRCVPKDNRGIRRIGYYGEQRGRVQRPILGIRSRREFGNILLFIVHNIVYNI